MSSHKKFGLGLGQKYCARCGDYWTLHASTMPNNNPCFRWNEQEKEFETCYCEGFVEDRLLLMAEEYIQGKGSPSPANQEP